VFGQLGNNIQKYYLSAIVAIAFIIISSSVTPAFSDIDYTYIDTMDLRTSTVDVLFDDIENLVKLFSNDAKVLEIDDQGPVKYARFYVDLPLWCDINTKIKFTKYNNYVIDFIEGSLVGSKLVISLEKTYGYDGTPDAGSLVTMVFNGKNIPCESFANTGHFEYAFDHGLDLMEQEGKKLQEKIDAQKATEPKIIPTTEEKKSTQTTETKPEVQIVLRGPPIVDSDGDGISDRFDNCKFDKETYNNYLDLDGCPDKVPQAPKPQPTIKDFDKDGIPDENEHT